MPLIKFNLPKSLGESTMGTYANIAKAIILSPYHPQDRETQSISTNTRDISYFLLG